jgi:hypothetical protein
MLLNKLPAESKGGYGYGYHYGHGYGAKKHAA